MRAVFNLNSPLPLTADQAGTQLLLDRLPFSQAGAALTRYLPSAQQIYFHDTGNGT
ncbi:MAG: hypothetical protein NZ933_07060 [Bacteroidia bacterium]|nr:hypothetical protein [Bacteroidia bacterium]